MSTTASKHMGLWRGHVGHVQLVWFVYYVCVHTIRSHLGGVNIGVKSMGSSDKLWKPPPYTCQGCVWSSYKPLGAIW